MRIDPVEVLTSYLRAQPDIPAGSPTGDMGSREAGVTTVYLEHSGGVRIVRDRMDRFDIEYDVYHQDRERAAQLAFRCRELLLEELPGEVVGAAEVLDVAEIASPRYYPDVTSREHMYGGEIAVFVAEP
ncbi:hypothetical protein [Streptomyces noursei]|uniref:hypothetical protein n=1 Tax=Streptomyces noursei TaxID=1971 RepID=UPI00167A7BC5|nr:hypothetical protein [Streptomyces noursei]MCZ1015610.1 hypothetical protein [Streptomyces noursei]GGW89451.1 hypothetical protein GCM10010341_07830 [Streptomyces noursei]